MSRARAQRKSSTERAAEISAAARDLAREEGLSALTLRALAARIVVAPGLIAHYRPSMDALVADTFREVVGGELDDIRAVLATLPSARARIETLIAMLLDGTRDDVTLIWVEAWALGRRNEVLAAAVRAEMDAWQGVVRAVVEEGVAAGEFDTADASATAWQMLGMIDGLNAQALVRWSGDGGRGPLLLRAVEGMLGLPRGALADPPPAPG